MEILYALKQLARFVRKRKEEHNWLYHLFITHDIAQQEAGKGYRALARLIRKGYFTTILTSNMDTALETALEEEGLSPDQYKVLVAEQDSHEEILEALDVPQDTIFIVKLPYVQARAEQVSFPCSHSPDIQLGLQNYFNQYIIIVGRMDQEEVAKAALDFQRERGIYYVRQDAPHSTDIVVQYIEKQKKRPEDFIITEKYGDFNTFFSTLESLINDGTDPAFLYPTSGENEVAPSPRRNTVKLPPIIGGNEEALPGPQSIERTEQQRTHPTVFISYSHTDEKHLQRLFTHLKPLERDGLIKEVWSDKNIVPGDTWKEKIRQAIEAANIAVLLISADFLASDFIAEFELPPLEKAANEKKMIILPVIVGFCDYEHKPLARIQSVNSPSKPLSSTNHDDNEKVWKQVTELIRKIAMADTHN